jgi:hypothetical protein
MEKINSKYRIQKRLMSPDVIERKVPGTKDSWKVYIAPIGSRSNMIAHEIIKTLQ